MRGSVCEWRGFARFFFFFFFFFYSLYIAFATNSQIRFERIRHAMSVSTKYSPHPPIQRAISWSTQRSWFIHVVATSICLLSKCCRSKEFFLEDWGKAVENAILIHPSINPSSYSALFRCQGICHFCFPRSTTQPPGRTVNRPGSSIRKLEIP